MPRFGFTSLISSASSSAGSLPIPAYQWIRLLWAISRWSASAAAISASVISSRISSTVFERSIESSRYLRALLGALVGHLEPLGAVLERGLLDLAELRHHQPQAGSGQLGVVGEHRRASTFARFRRWALRLWAPRRFTRVAPSSALKASALSASRFRASRSLRRSARSASRS